MSTQLQHPVRSVAAEHGARWERLLVGLLIIAAGVAWFLDDIGVAVPWRLLPAVALIIVGLLLVTTRRLHGLLVGLGMVLIVISLIMVGPSVRYAGPAGNRTLQPAVAEWPVTSTLSTGNVVVDLSGVPLPDSGRMQVDVGVGQIRLILPAVTPIELQTEVSAGDITVDGRSVDSGLNVQWTNGASVSSAVVIDAQVGVGSIEVRHD